DGTWTLVVPASTAGTADRRPKEDGQSPPFKRRHLVSMNQY
ncbi:hypothetical protein GWI33_011067, partial [Rhynchophorus ferrugineus]